MESPTRIHCLGSTGCFQNKSDTSASYPVSRKRYLCISVSGRWVPGRELPWCERKVGTGAWHHRWVQYQKEEYDSNWSGDSKWHAHSLSEFWQREWNSSSLAVLRWSRFMGIHGIQENRVIFCKRRPKDRTWGVTFKQINLQIRQIDSLNTNSDSRH